MTEYKQKVLELRRMRHEHECRLARRRETFAEWFKVSVAIATTVIITAATLAILWTHNKRVERELEIEAIKQDIHVMTMKAASAVERNPNNGLARFALMLGTALYNAKVVDRKDA